MTVMDTPPCGEMVLRTLAMPADANPNGDIFGGWIMAQMDLAGGAMAKDLTRGRVATVAVNSMKFIRPVRVGDVVCCYGHVGHTGTTSITLHLEIWVRPVLRKDTDEEQFLVTEADFTYVAIDDDGNKRPLPDMNN